MTLKRKAFFLLTGLLSLLILVLFWNHLDNVSNYTLILPTMLTITFAFINKKVFHHLVYVSLFIYVFYAFFIFFNFYNFSVGQSWINIYNSTVLAIYLLCVLLLTLLYLSMVLLKKLTNKKWIKWYLITNIMAIVVVITSFGVLHVFDLRLLDQFLYAHYRIMIAILLTFLSVGLSLFFYRQPSSVIQKEHSIMDEKTTYRKQLSLYLITVGYAHYFLCYWLFIIGYQTSMEALLVYVVPLTAVIIGNYYIIKYQKLTYVSFLPLLFLGYTVFLLFSDGGFLILEQWFYTLPIATYLLCIYFMLTTGKRSYFIGALLIQIIYPMTLLLYIDSELYRGGNQIAQAIFQEPFSLMMLTFYLFMIAISIFGYFLLEGYYKQKNNLIQFSFFTLFVYGMYAILFMIDFDIAYVILVVPLVMYYAFMIRLNSFRLKHRIDLYADLPRIETESIGIDRTDGIINNMNEASYSMREDQIAPDKRDHVVFNDQDGSKPMVTTETSARSLSLTALIEIFFLILVYQTLSKDYINFNQIIQNELSFIPGFEMLSFSFGLSVIPLLNTIVRVIFFMLFTITVVLIVIKSQASKWLMLTSLIVLTLFNIILIYVPYRLISEIAEFFLDLSVGTGINFWIVFRILGPLPYFLALYILIGFLIFFRKPRTLWERWIYPYNLANMRLKQKKTIEESPFIEVDRVVHMNPPAPKQEDKPLLTVDKPVELSKSQIDFNGLKAQLKDLNDLLTSGIINQDDFDKLKTGVVTKINELNTNKT